MALLGVAGGCGTTRWTDTPRTGTQQLLISSAIDRSINELDLRPITGRSVYLNAGYLSDTIDQNYVVSTLRQKLVASGCMLAESQDKAEVVVEARSGAVGTDRHEVTIGVPSINVPPLLTGVAGVPTSSIPEIPFIKKTDQRAIAKLALFAYDRESGRAVWQSGAVPVTSTAKDTWILGAGPLQTGTIYKSTKFAGAKLPIASVFNPWKDDDDASHRLLVTNPAVFYSADEVLHDVASGVSQATHTEPPQQDAAPVRAATK